MSAGGAGRGRARRLREHGARSAAGRSGRVCPPCLTAATFWERSRREGRGTPPTRGTRVAEERLQRWTPRKARGMRAAAGVAACPGPGPHPEPVRSPRNRQCAVRPWRARRPGPQVTQPPEGPAPASFCATNSRAAAAAVSRSGSLTWGHRPRCCAAAADVAAAAAAAALCRVPSPTALEAQ